MGINYYRRTHKYYCGVDLHSTSLYLCILGQDGAIVLHRSLPCDPNRFLLAIAPFREDLVVGVECVYSWYWLADLCEKEGIAFVLGHALYMRSIHGAKAKSDIARFPTVGDFASYSRLVKCQHSSNGKNLGTGGAKIGNAYLKWAFSEAAVLFVAKSEHGRTVLARLERKHGKAKALSLLAHKIGRTVYFMLARKRAFDPQRFAAAA